MKKYTGENRVNLSSLANENFKEHHAQLKQDFLKSKNLNEEINLSLGEISPLVEDGDIHSFLFRQLSATIVGGGSWKATDFSDEKMLKKGMRMLENKPIYLNHDMYVGNEVGYVGKPKWTAAYKNSQGKDIPAGIDASMNVDGVLYPEIVRKLSGSVPLIKSSSVTVLFKWEASHEFASEWDFYSAIGSTANDGRMGY